MFFKKQLTLSLLGTIKGIVVANFKRQVNKKFKNEDDVKDYPVMVTIDIIEVIAGDPRNVGQRLSLKLKKADNLPVGKQFVLDGQKVKLVNETSTVFGKYSNLLSVRADYVEGI